MKNGKAERLGRYLFWAFGIAWVLQSAAGLLFRAGQALAYSALLAASMFAPLLAAALSGAGLKEMGWRPRLKGNIGWLLAAWFGPAVLGTVGAILYFWMTPDALDTSFSYLYNALGAEGVRQMEDSGLSVSRYAIINCVASLSYAPWLNMLFAIGEEAGWRGVLYPALKSRWGTRRAELPAGSSGASGTGPSCFWRAMNTARPIGARRSQGRCCSA